MPSGKNISKFVIIIFILIFILISFEINERFFYAIEMSKDETITGTTRGLLREIIWNDNEFRSNLKKHLDEIIASFKPGLTPKELSEKYGAKDVYFMLDDSTITDSASGAMTGLKLNPHFQCNLVAEGKKDYHYFGIDPEIHCEQDVFGVSFRAGGKTVRIMFELKKLEKFFNRDKLTALMKSIAQYQSLKAVVLHGSDAGGPIAAYYENNDLDVKNCVLNEYYIQLNGLSLLKMAAYSRADPLSALKAQSKITFTIMIFLFFSAYLIIEKYGRLKSSMASLKSDYSSLSEFSFKALSIFPFPAVLIENDKKIRPLNAASEILLNIGQYGAGSIYSIDSAGRYYDPIISGELDFFKDNHALADFIESSTGFGQSELLIKTPDSSFRPYRCQLVKSGGMSLLLFIDTSEEKDREIQIGIASEHNMAALFLAKLAHELRNPLNSISMSLQMARGLPCDGEYQGKTAAQIDFCLEEIERLNRIIKNYLGRRPMEIETREVDVNEILLYSISIIKKYISGGNFAKQIELKAEINQERLLIAGNYDLLIQAFYNILLNSVQAVSEMIEKSSRYIGTLSITESVGEKSVEIIFADNGGGIAAQALERIFEAGYSTKTGGSGLGLAIVSEIVKQHGAIINIESCGAETKVKISFPLSEGEQK